MKNKNIVYGVLIAAVLIVIFWKFIWGVIVGVVLALGFVAYQRKKGEKQ